MLYLITYLYSHFFTGPRSFLGLYTCAGFVSSGVSVYEMKYARDSVFFGASGIPLTYLLTHLLTYSLTHSLTHSLSYLLTDPLTYFHMYYSGCVNAILALSVLLFPYNRIMIFPVPIPIPTPLFACIWYFIHSLTYFLLTCSFICRIGQDIMGLYDPHSNVGHIAHLTGS